MATITASQKFENEVKAVIAKGEADERASKASLPAAMQPAAVRQLLGGAVFEVAKSDNSGNLFGFNLGKTPMPSAKRPATNKPATTSEPVRKSSKENPALTISDARAALAQTRVDGEPKAKRQRVAEC